MSGSPTWSTTPPTCWSGSTPISTASPPRAWATARPFDAAYPQAAYRRIEANRPLPFADRSFDIAVSNAVLEHVGSRDDQVLSCASSRGSPKRPSSACRTGISRSSITPRSRSCISGAGASPCLPAARQGGMGGRSQSDSDVPATARGAGACRASARDRHHRDRAWAVQLQPLSVHRRVSRGRRWTGRARDRVRRAGRRKAIKSLRRKASLLYEPRKTRRRTSRQIV